MAKIKLTKTLYVGIGGTGVATLLKVKKCFIDSYGEIPPMIGFLAIDTDKNAVNKSITSNEGEDIKLLNSELCVCTVRGALNVYRQNPRVFDWVPFKNVDKLIGIAGGGAGSIRSNGRFIAYYNKKAIESSIQTAVNKIKAPLPFGSKYEVDTNKKDVTYDPIVNVVASIAGGTGSGMLIDVLCIIQEAFKNTETIKLYPWIVLPEIFKVMAAGPVMNNVLYNSYGALRSLDYLMHYNPKSPAINFGYTQIKQPLFNYAFVINNTNQAGITFNTFDDLTDSMAKSMFLPANKMGDEIDTPFDNVYQQKLAGTYDIINKKAWAATASSAELIYDRQAVGRIYAYTIIEQLCNSMLQSPTDGAVDADNFIDDPDVSIRENKGRDDVIDALLSPRVEYLLDIDEQTTQADINTYIANHCNGNQIDERLKNNLNNKIINTSKKFDDKVADIMSQKQGKIDAAIKFIEGLKKIIAICKEEMSEEEKSFQTINNIPIQWDFYLREVKNTGIKGFIKKTNDVTIQELQNKLAEVVSNRREEIRRKWALSFYNKFEEKINAKLLAVEGLRSVIDKIGKGTSTKRLIELQRVQSTSKFQIFLHKDDALKASRFRIDDNIKAAFVTFLGNGVSPWIGQSEEYIKNKLWAFAEKTEVVEKAVNTDINTILTEMPSDIVKEYLERLKNLASPLWTYNDQGYHSEAKELDKFIVVGVDNRDTSILKTDNKYNTFFKEGDNNPSFASTNQSDRVYILVVEDLLPIYAVNNFKAYEYDHQQKVNQNFMMANYLDESLNSRINSENFSLIPNIEKDNLLKNWVYGFIIGHIHYDKVKHMYWIYSKRHGDPLKRYRFDLNKNRAVAYELFKSVQLYDEVENAIKAQIAKIGENAFKEKINEIKTKGSYLDEYSQLSSLEKNNIDDNEFAPVKNLIGNEIRFMTD